MKWYGIIVLLFGLVGIVYLGMNTEKLEVDFGESNYISKQTPKLVINTNQEFDAEKWYVQQAEKGKQKGIDQIKERIIELKSYKSGNSDIEKQYGIQSPQIQNAVNQELELLENLIHGEEDQRKNPAKYFTQTDLVNIAMEYYKVKPDGTLCDEDRRWVEDREACIREDTARKKFYSLDLNWIKDHPEIYLK